MVTTSSLLRLPSLLALVLCLSCLQAVPEPGPHCQKDEDCAPSDACHNGVCTGCLVCTQGEQCIRAQCVVVPCTGGSCATGQRCVDGACVKCDQVEVCDNGLDDDCDGLTDCADPHCLSAACGPETACAVPRCTVLGACVPMPKAEGTVCRPAVGACDREESCDGVSTECPADTVFSTDHVCRPAAGDCDVQENCDGQSTACPADQLQPFGHSCRPAALACDAEEFCDGIGALCPADAVLPPGHICRPTAGACDAPEACNGVTKQCPADLLLPAGHICRPAAGDCDVSEGCDGKSPACPPDTLRPAGVVCRAAVSLCDGVERCTGTDPACPTDKAAPSGTFCDTCNRCDGKGQCVASNDHQDCTLCEACKAGTCVPELGEDLKSECPGFTCTEFIAGWQGNACVTYSGPTASDGMCQGSGLCADLASSCSGLGAPVISCGSAECKKACNAGDPRSAYSRVADACFVADQHGCAAGEACDLTGTCQSVGSPLVEDFNGGLHHFQILGDKSCLGHGNGDMLYVKTSDAPYVRGDVVSTFEHARPSVTPIEFEVQARMVGQWQPRICWRCSGFGEGPNGNARQGIVLQWELNTEVRIIRWIGAGMDQNPYYQSCTFFSPSDWNVIRVRDEGGRIQAWINGTLCVDYSDPELLTTFDFDKNYLAFLTRECCDSEIHLDNFRYSDNGPLPTGPPLPSGNDETGCY